MLFEDSLDLCPNDGTRLSTAGPAIGDLVDGKFRIEGLLGAGAMGTVYRAVQLALERSVAVKTVRGSALANPAVVERFKREALAIARLHHPNIISIYDFGVAPDLGAYLVMELLEGRNLREEIKHRGAIAPAESVTLMRQICSAVHSAHESGVIHRDLKPGNIVLERTADGPRPKVLDFGIAKLQGGFEGDSTSLTGGGMTLGTPRYMSPEQCLGRPLDARSDVYALGCILYEMLAGRPPFIGTSIAAIALEHTAEQPLPPSVFAPGISRLLDAVALRALSKEPGDRFQTAADFGRALGDAISGSATALGPGGYAAAGPRSGAQPATRPAFFLRTKLLPPRPAPALLPRPRLTKRLAANLQNPVTLVTANAGSGKTTLVADFVRNHAGNFVWYQLDRGDADPLVFLGYIAHGIKQVVPGYGEATASYLQEAAAELASHPERAVDVLLNEVLERIEQQFILVLDDYHHLGQDTPVHRVVDRLLAYLPDLLHVVIISRDVPPLSLARLRSRSSIAVIDREELLFTDQETKELFRSVFDLEMTPEQVAEYRQRTNGWITALQLVRQVAQREAASTRTGEAPPPDLVEILRHSEYDIFDYFAEEVFADESDETQRLLLRISLLDRVEMETCAALYPHSNCGVVLPALVRRNVFITVASDDRGEEYRLHPLFRDFLRRRFRAEAGQEGVATVHRHSAAYFLGREQWEQALDHLLGAHDVDRAAWVIAGRGGEWIAEGKLATLMSFSEQIPPATLEANPRVLLHRAEVARLRGEFEAARGLFSRAATLLREQGDPEGHAEAMHSLATIARRSGDFDAAFAYLDSAVALSGDDALVRVKCGNTRGLCLFARGQWAAAEGEFRAALQSAESRGDEYWARLIAHNVGMPAMMRGDFSEAIRWLRRMLRDAGTAPPMPQEATAHLNVGRCLLFRGDMEGCEQHLDEAMERCAQFNLVALRGEILEAYGNLARERGDTQRARECYDRAARAHEDAGIDVTTHELLEERALLALQGANPAEARTDLGRLIEARRAAGNEHGYHTALLARGRLWLAQGDSTHARVDIQPALDYFRSHGLYFYEAQASLALAICEFDSGRERDMVECLGRALDLAARYDLEYWLRREAQRDPRVFSHPAVAALVPGDIRETIAPAPADAPTAPRVEVAVLAPAAPSADLTILMLGPVDIGRDPSRPLGVDAWTTKRSRDILCFIASRRHRRALKDTIIDTFWADADFETVEKNFHPTVSHIRKALNSNQPLKQNFLVYRGGEYILNPDFTYRIDIEEFDRLTATAEAARRSGQNKTSLECLEQAITLYRGEFMQGSYDDWVEEQRGYYREQYLHALETLAAAAQQGGDWSRSLVLIHAILRDDPFREDIHCMAMRAHAALGNRGAVKEQYESLCSLLQRELGVDPAPATQTIYRAMLK